MGNLLFKLKRFLNGAQIGNHDQQRPMAHPAVLNGPVIYPVVPFRNQRLLNEIQMIAPRFVESGGIYYDEKDLDWIMIPQYHLPERLEERVCKLLIIPPAIYPDTPPIGFYLDREIHLRSGNPEPNAIGKAAYGAADLLNCGWYWYCVTIQHGPGGWQPSADFRRGDNLSTFLNMARESLTNDF